MDGSPPLLSLRGISKLYPGVRALDSVDLDILPGEIHVLLGENGAGKSTLIKTILGIEAPNGGEIRWKGRRLGAYGIREAYAMGIAAIYQELNNVGCLSVAENLYLGNEIPLGRLRGTVSPSRQRAAARAALARVGLAVDPAIAVERLGVGQKQLLEIARALDRKAELVIMDEPTSSLSRSEIDQLLGLMAAMKAQGIAILFITHKLDEAKKIGDRVTVLKDGKKVGTLGIAEADEELIIKMMVGRKLEEKYPRRSARIGAEALRVEGLTGARFRDVSFSVRSGELLGLFGLVGAGRTETLRGIFGADRVAGGAIYLEGELARIERPADAIRRGVSFVTENRKEEGLTLIHDVVENATLPSLGSFCSLPAVVDQGRRYAATMDYGRRLNLRPLHVRKRAMDFSGGNQQKIVVEKWLMTGGKVFLFDEPTKGVDVGAKTEIYGIMNRLLEGGAAVIMVSSEMQEILGMSDRIVTMYEGRVTGEIANGPEATQERLLIMATGGGLE
ncbi:MAG TPA: sugar ABC transporter ATP-binding protein [Spirochaetales bacterium]|nr:sugar ABC transporter ATP-binding protein [Spirochaetales bacterium]